MMISVAEYIVTILVIGWYYYTIIDFVCIILAGLGIFIFGFSKKVLLLGVIKAEIIISVVEMYIYIIKISVIYLYWRFCMYYISRYRNVYLLILNKHFCYEP